MPTQRNPRPFSPKPGQPGSTVRWTDYPRSNREHEGIVWSLAPGRGVWVIWDNGLSGATLVHVSVPKSGAAGAIIGPTVVYGGTPAEDDSAHAA